MNGTDSYFTNFIAIDAYRANFYNGNGGDNHMKGAHGWGFKHDQNYGVGLRANYTFESLGPIDALDTVADNPLVAGWWLRGYHGGNIGSTLRFVILAYKAERITLEPQALREPSP